MKTSLFSFDLPAELIAQSPPADREAARLLVLDRGSGRVAHSRVGDLGSWIDRGTVVVLNDTRVRKARLFGRGPGGRRAEFLLLQQRGDGRWEAITARAGRAKTGAVFVFSEGRQAEVEAVDGGKRILRFSPPIDEEWIERNGHVPLPPYIRRPDRAEDQGRYQTVYARATGSAAAPTAGLHFTDRLLDELRSRGAVLAWVTLHVGLGTFQPIRTEDIEHHHMHEEAWYVPTATKAVVEAAVRDGRPVLAVGTTVVRVLESAWAGEGLADGAGSTRLFIAPGYRFRVVRMLLTNFHTPASSLLVLVSAFAGRQLILETYAQAIRERYRFFSYGDAMLIR